MRLVTVSRQNCQAVAAYAQQEGCEIVSGELEGQLLFCLANRRLRRT
jgi:hypothetical protein